MKSHLLTQSLIVLLISSTAGFAQRTMHPSAMPMHAGEQVSYNSYFDQPPIEQGSAHSLASNCQSCQQNFHSDQSGPSTGRFGDRVRSWILPTESCFDGFISPITNPFYFEDPRALTEFRPVFVTHNLPAAVGGGTVNVYAAQLRARLSENVSLIAVKDGYLTSSSPLIDDGWADLGLGLKFHLYRDPVAQQLISAGATFEAPSGSAGALQGLGSGNLNLFVSSARRLGSTWNHMSSSGVRLPMNGDTGSTSTFVSQHLSRPVTDRVFVLTELNWFRWISSGTGGIPGVEGLDVANLGSSDVTGNNIVTWAFGSKILTNRRNELGAAYEIPISGRRDIAGARVTAHWAIRY